MNDNDDAMGTIGSSHGWIATLKDGRVRLHDDLNPVASDTDPKHILLPPLVTLPHCQTQIVTNVAISSSSPEEDDCVVAIKFLGSQLSFAYEVKITPSGSTSESKTPASSPPPIIFSKKDDMFRIPGSGGHLIGSWDLCAHKHTPKFQSLRFRNLPNLTKTKRELLNSCCTSEHLVESRATGETFLLKWYRKTTASGTVRMKTKALMVFKLDEEGNAVYTQDIGDVAIFLSKSEPFCVLASSFPIARSFPIGLCPNHVYIVDVDEFGMVDLADSSMSTNNVTFRLPYHIPPQNIDS